MNPDLKFYIAGRQVVFNRYRDGVFYYRVATEEGVFEFPYQLAPSDVTVTLQAQDKAIYFMKAIKTALAQNTLLRVC